MAYPQFTPVYAGRSDGETEVRSKKHGKEFNGPSNDQLDRVANPDDNYEPLDHDHPITLEWKRQLGGMLQREMKAQAEFPWFLMFFPENYRLYKHNKDSRDHLDAYLYGYPQGRKKRFRSAQEFFPHFLWLMEGKTEDYGDCACKNCSGEWVHKIEPLPGRGGFFPPRKDLTSVKSHAQPKKEILSARKDNLTSKTQSVPRVVINPNPSANPIRPYNITPGATGAATGSNINSRPKQAQSVMIETPLPPTRSREQELDMEYAKFTYRLGELVWFNRGSAWGLSLVIKRDSFYDSIRQPPRMQARYLVQPLSHPFSHPPSKLIISDDSLRPWLAWSAPGPTHKSLAGKVYTNIDWKAVIAGQFGSGDSEVDGSILSAKQLDESFTLLSPLSNNTTTTGERSYNALFLGGEKIYVGDPVRLRLNQGQDILIIHQIIEKLKPNSTNINFASVHVIGDVYRLLTSTVTNPPDQAHLAYPPPQHLPIRIKADLEFRNSVTIPHKKTRMYWKQVQAATRLSIADLKGRWYESSILLPVLRGSAVFTSEIQRGEVTDVGEWINGRGDANGAAGRAGVRFRERLEAVGKAVPDNTILEGAGGAGEGGIVTATGAVDPQGGHLGV